MSRNKRVTQQLIFTSVFAVELKSNGRITFTHSISFCRAPQLNTSRNKYSWLTSHNAFYNIRIYWLHVHLNQTNHHYSLVVFVQHFRWKLDGAIQNDWVGKVFECVHPILFELTEITQNEETMSVVLTLSVKWHKHRDEHGFFRVRLLL